MHTECPQCGSRLLMTTVMYSGPKGWGQLCMACDARWAIDPPLGADKDEEDEQERDELVGDQEGQ